MHQLLLLLAAGTSPGSLPADTSETIVVTASREPISLGDAPVSASLFDRDALERLAFPLTSDILRVVPGASVSTSGPIPAACERTSDFCSSARFSAGIGVVARAPNPVDTP